MDGMAPFVPGLALARALYEEVVRPLLDEAFPRLGYAAGLLGPGSEVLGFDTERSTDHDWGPRLQVFVADDGSAGLCAEITAMFTRRLPAVFHGYRTRFPVAREHSDRPRHRVEVTDLASWLDRQLGFDPRQAVTPASWLATPTQRLAEITAGEVFHDGPGELGRARAGLGWYPRDVWLYVLACQWRRIDQEEAFPGRCAEVGDELGSAIVTARLARDLMRLCLLMHRRYPPYSKWLGTAFARLPGAPVIGQALAAAVAATSWPAREQHLSRACTAAAALHNQLGITKPLDPRTRRFHERPYQVLYSGRFAAALLAAITDPAVRRLPAIGAVDGFSDSTDALGITGFLHATVAAAGTAASDRASG
jgi:Domain of unknown function (DUF4037)